MARKSKKYDRFFSTFEWAYPQALKAKKDGYLIESLILIVANIDALLRVLIYQKSQLNSKSNKVKNDDLFIQKPRDSKYPYGSEKSIIEAAHKSKVIDKKNKTALLAFLKSRNNFIHRLFLGNWKYAQLDSLIEKGKKYIVKLQMRAVKLAKKQEELGMLTGPSLLKDAPQEYKQIVKNTLQKYFE